MNIKSITIAIIISLGSIGNSIAQFSFDIIKQSVAWGDYDGDGSLDFAIMGLIYPFDPWNIITEIYRNTGNGQFELTVCLDPLNDGELEWGDLDGDGDLDLVVAGTKNINTGGEEYVFIFENKGSHHFEKKPIGSFQGILPTSLIVVDFDNEGDLDLLITGTSDGDVKTVIYTNDGDWKFTKLDNLLPVTLGHMDVSDFDRDGDIDLLITNIDLKHTAVYQNDGSGRFTISAGIQLQEIESNFERYVKWVDFDSDGDMDIYYACLSNEYELSSKLYVNEGNSFSSPFTISHHVIVGSEPLWADIDCDGRPDLFVVGIDSTDIDDFDRPFKSVLYTYNEDQTFDTHLLSIPPIVGAYRLGDFDNDLDLDLIRAGGVGRPLPWITTIELLINNSGAQNLQPSKPVIDRIEQEDNAVVFYWHQGFDPETPRDALTYNIYVIDKNTGKFVLPAHADIQTGSKTIPSHGNTYQNTRWQLNNLPQSNYEFGVQTVDAAFVSSEFSKVNFERIIVANDHELEYPKIHVSIFPNPVKEIARFRLGTTLHDVRICVYDMTGKKLIQEYFETVQAESYNSLYTSDLQMGLYLLEIKSRQGSTRTKFVSAN
jgi:hypothetical protein